ncbi:MAG: DUF1566 domain-containing protein [Rhodocyclaceae bacterium]|nr:DUF1566 domain-containing protein [Rhodocyclaceae bacterium]
MKSSITENLVPETYGSPFEGGFYGGKIRIGLAIFAIAWAPKAEGETTSLWLPSYTQVPNADSCFDSMANTIAMAEAGSPLGKWALGLEINGYNDWCVPARDVLELGYRYLKPGTYENSCSFRDGDNPSSIPAGYPYTEQSPAQTISEAFKAGGEEAFDEVWYWSSTQFSSTNAWGQTFNDGYPNLTSKKYGGRARACRLIQLNP